MDKHLSIRKILKLYEDGFYEEAFFGIKNIPESEKELLIKLTPVRFFSERVKNIPISFEEDIEHFKNRYYLKKFDWFNWVKAFSLLFGFVLFLVGGSYPNVLFLFYSFRPELLGLVLIIIGIVLHFLMRNINKSRNYIRCKNCGRFQKKNLLLSADQCIYCNIQYFLPEYSRIDNWYNLEEETSINPDGQYVDIVSELKRKYPKEYAEYRKSLGLQ